jgi:hypothetical protein
MKSQSRFTISEAIAIRWLRNTFTVCIMLPSWEWRDAALQRVSHHAPPLGLPPFRVSPTTRTKASP